MAKKLHFKYQSIGNLCRLLATIQFEKMASKRDISIWHQRFDREECDALFEKFLGDIYPEGANIGEKEINNLVSYAEHFLEKDKEAQNIAVQCDKFKNSYWVYFKIDNKVFPCDFCQHSKTITQICKDYFKGFEHIDLEELQKFIIENFEIKSKNSTVESIAKDAQYIALEIRRLKEF